MSFYSSRGSSSPAQRYRYRIPTVRPPPSTTAAVPSLAENERDITEGLLPVPIQTFKIPRADTLVLTDPVKIRDLQYLGSYNWIGSKDQPTILVPGSPPEWRNITTPFTVAADVGTSFADQNSHWFPSANLVPLIVAVNTVQRSQSESGSSTKSFDWSSVDLVTDRNGLRKLLRWINGTAERDFRIDLQLAGNTVIFSRWEKSTQAAMSGFTFGFNFEEKTTNPAKDCEGSTGHHRIVKYDLNGLKVVVRFEVDACLPPVVSSSTNRNRSSTIDDLTLALSSTSISSKSGPPVTFTSIPVGGALSLRVGEGGSVVPQTSLIELSTRSRKRLVDNRWKEDFPQLFLSQTPYHYLGAHDSGHFYEIQKREKTCQSSFTKLRGVLGLIREVAIDHGEQGRLSLVCRGGKLELYGRRDDNSLLPESLIRLFRLSSSNIRRKGT
ncbi:hypothetical protein BDP27DRAFT_1335277 [Rhodocollybia butyracea]|uniref:Uncharacterized protein n=1 Tax=Rhodocollybia butyracea TaxID=206335 RepID=A0A9P5PHC7_9AGAR|nr:hypothetical protein BDP27DRAFT_1335277 [Rhodocollybia butyracea]